MNRIVRQTLRAGLATALLLPAACDDTVPTGSLAPELGAEAQLSESGAVNALDRLARFDTPRNGSGTIAQKWIGPAGGRLELQGFAVEVPAGAVAEATQFSIRLPANPQNMERVVAVFGPHGAKFAVPVRLEFPLAGTSVAGSSTATVVWWNGSDWVDIRGEPTTDGARIRASTDHFSTYGTSDGRGGGTLVSGG